MDKLNPASLVDRAIGISAETGGYVDVIKLANLLGIDVFLSTNNNEDFHAKIEVDPDTKRYNIVVNPSQPFERQRFSIAHELAHYVLHKKELDKLGKLNRDDDMNKVEEEKADNLAAEILMPTTLVEKYVDEIGLDKKQEVKRNIIEQIANYFKVSRTVAAIKLRELNFYVPFTYFA